MRPFSSPARPSEAGVESLRLRIILQHVRGGRGRETARRECAPAPAHSVCGVEGCCGAGIARARRTRASAPVSMRNATVYGVSSRLRLDVVLNNLVAWAHTTGAIRLAERRHVMAAARARPRCRERGARVPGGSRRARCLERPSTSGRRRRPSASAISQRSSALAFRAARSRLQRGRQPIPRSYRVDFSKLASALPGPPTGVDRRARRGRARDRVRGRRPDATTTSWVTDSFG